MYLIHGPLILFLVKPLFGESMGLPIDSLILTILAIVYFFIIFMLARLLSQPINFFIGRLGKISGSMAQQ